MSTNVKVYKSTDRGAPTLSGTAGDLVYLLDACLVNGYNSRTVTSVTRSGSTVTVVCPDHRIEDKAIAQIDGCTPSDYNGEWYMTYVDANTLTFQITGSPASPASGSMTCKIPGAGWTKPYTATNMRAYVQGSKVGTSQHGILVDDTTTTYASFTMGETIVAIDTISGSYSPAHFMVKSGTADTTLRPWFMVADNKTFYLTVTTASNTYRTIVFGLFKSHKVGDLYNQIICGGDNHTDTFFTWQSGLGPGAKTPHVSRSYTQTGGAITVGKIGDKVKSSGDEIGSWGLTYPSPVDSSLYVSPFWIGESDYLIRGHFVGILAPLHQRPMAHGDTFTGTGSLAGRRYMCLYSEAGSYFVEISNTWWT